MERVIFLDIDGILVHSKCKNNEFDPECVKRLGSLCMLTGAKLVLHSSWIYIDSLAELRDKFINCGLYDFFHQDFIASHISHFKENAIRDWSLRHSNDIKAVILDDESINTFGWVPQVKVFGGWWTYGLQDHHCQEVIKLFQEDDDDKGTIASQAYKLS